MTGSLLLVINGVILTTLLAVPGLALPAIRLVNNFPGENSDNILTRYESLSGFTKTMLALGIFVTVSILTASGSHIPKGKFPDFIPFAFGLLAHGVSRLVCARQIAAYNNYSYQFYQRMYKDWRTISRIELIIALIYFIRLASASHLPADFTIWSEQAGSLITSLYYLIFSSFTVRHDVARLLDKPVPESMLFEALSVIGDNLDKICELKGINGWRYGNKTYLDISIVLPYDITLGAVQEIEDSLRSSIQEKLRGISIRFFVSACQKDCNYGNQCPAKTILKKKDIPEKEE